MSRSTAPDLDFEEALVLGALLTPLHSHPQWIYAWGGSVWNLLGPY